MTIKKIILIVILFTAIVMGVIFLLQKSNKEKLALAEKEKKTQEENKKGVVYKLAENGCKLGVESVDGERLGMNFHKICGDKSFVAVDEQTCIFQECPVLKEIDTFKWAIYKNEKYNFSLKYPKDWQVSVNEPDGGMKKIEVLFSNKDCPGDGFEVCPDGFAGYRISFYEANLKQQDINISNLKYYKERANKSERVKLFSGEEITLYIEDEFNEKNFKENIDFILPGAQTILDKNEYSVYFIGDFRGNADILEYFKASLMTFSFDKKI